ncbi:MAG TPA: hypothetical protein VMV18_13055 [bacterium]|nr:hypothetical protein [bacterium]
MPRAFLRPVRVSGSLPAWSHGGIPDWLDADPSGRWILASSPTHARLTLAASGEALALEGMPGDFWVAGRFVFGPGGRTVHGVAARRAADRLRLLGTWSAERGTLDAEIECASNAELLGVSPARTLVALEEKRDLVVRALPSFAPVASFAVTEMFPLAKGEPGPRRFDAAAFAPDDSAVYVAWSRPSPRSFDPARPSMVTRIEIASGARTSSAPGVLSNFAGSLAVIAGGTRLVAGQPWPQPALVLDAAGLTLHTRLDGSSGDVSAAIDGTRFVCASATTIEHDAVSLSRVAVHPRAFRAVLLRDGTVVRASVSGTLDIGEGRAPRPSLSWLHAAGERILFGSPLPEETGALDLQTFSRSPAPLSESELAALAVPRPRDDGHWEVSSPNGKRVAVFERGVRGTLRDAAMRAPDVELSFGLLDRTSTTFAAFSPDGSRLVAGGVSGWLAVWDGHTGAPVRNRPGGSWLGAVRALAVSPDGKFLVVARSRDPHALEVHDVDTPRIAGELVGHYAPAIAATFAPSGRLLTLGEDQRILEWDLSALTPPPAPTP